MANIPADWLYLAVMWTIIAGGVISLARFAGRKNKEVANIRQEAEAEAEKARQEAEAASLEARTRAVAQRVGSETANVARGKTDIHPDDAWQITRKAAYRVVEEFIRHHPEAVRKDPPRIDRDVFIRWLVTHRQAAEAEAET